jgi:signal transduction histidine kinase
VCLSIRCEVDDSRFSESVLLPVAQELVINALKHAGPSAIDVALTRSNGAVTLQVDDDGVGIDTAVIGRAVHAGHVGLAMVRRRVEDARGQLDIAARPGGGTRSTVVLPV